ncbi:necrosis inducing -domain-containing [Fusarium sporotrichioides]|uniref:Necrosis inducing-domain-containing n=1 Tax=Fusarium sporotrichioides TaxID=5514 RepID=A0A395RY68_FUSSP|nr:necrosis inducing -domain-containing [Fusarium sporotrichioides]
MRISTVATVLAAGVSVEAHLIGNLPNGAHEMEHKFQPLTDFDKDGCYYTSAIDANGNTNGGLTQSNVIGKGPAADCRDNNRLERNNVYSRRRCNNGWCAIMYEYYFEKDQAAWGSLAGGHTHDWENVVIFVKDDQVKRVAPSCHGKYGGATNSPRVDGKRAKVVYHKDGASTHCWRIANAGDDAVENYTGRWYIGNLVGWNNWPVLNGQSLRDRVFNAWHGGIRPKFWDHENSFTNTLRAAAGNGVPGFDPARDG